jgi:hypothetical protein
LIFCVVIFDECIELDFHSFSVGSITDIMNRNVMESLNTIRRELEDLKDKIPKIEELIGSTYCNIPKFKPFMIEYYQSQVLSSS